MDGFSSFFLSFLFFFEKKMPVKMEKENRRKKEGCKKKP
jgi:hypothetical protein